MHNRELSRQSLFQPPQRLFPALVRTALPTVHLTAYVTGGLCQLYKTIKSPKQYHEDGACTNVDGCFTPTQEMELLARRYSFLQVIGKGQSSVLIQAQDTFRGGALVSIKVLHRYYSVLGTQEADCIRRLNQADVHHFSATLRLYTMFLFDGHYCLVFELLHPQPLHKHFLDNKSSQKLQRVRQVAVRLLSAIGFLHQQNVIHADLKPENLLLQTAEDWRSVKVIDFGNAIRCIHNELSLYYDDFELQTLLYRAPEVMLGVPFSKEIDLWSLGCILVELYTGQPLFRGRDTKTVLRNMVQLLGPLPVDIFQRGKFFPDFHTFSAKVTQQDATLRLLKKLDFRDYSFANFIAQLLIYDPGARTTVMQAAQHPFLAPEIGLGYLIQGNKYGEGRGYHPMLITEQLYKHSPRVPSSVSKLHMTSLDLLHHGTGSGDGDASPCGRAGTDAVRKVAQVTPVMRQQLSSHPPTTQPGNATVLDPTIDRQTTDATTETRVSHPRRSNTDAIIEDRAVSPRSRTMDARIDDRVSGYQRQTMDAITDDRVLGPRRRTTNARVEDRVSGPHRQTMDTNIEDRVSGPHRQTMDTNIEDRVYGPRRRTMDTNIEDRVSGPHRWTMDTNFEDRVSGPHRQTMDTNIEDMVSGPRRQTMDTNIEDMVSGPRRQTMDVNIEDMVSGPHRGTMDTNTEDRVSGLHRQTMDANIEGKVSGPHRHTMDTNIEDRVSGPHRQTMDTSIEGRVSGPHRQTMDANIEDRVSGPHRRTMDTNNEDRVSGPHRRTVDTNSEDRVSGPHRRTMIANIEDRVSGPHIQTMDTNSEDRVSGPHRQTMGTNSEDRVSGPRRQTTDDITNIEDRVSGQNRRTTNAITDDMVSGLHRQTVNARAKDRVSGPRRQLISPAEVTPNSGLAAKSSAERSNVRSPRSNTTHSRHATGIRRTQQRSRVTPTVEANNVESIRDTNANVRDEITPRMHFDETMTGGDNRGDCPARAERVTPSDSHQASNTTVVILESDLYEDATPLMHSAQKTSMGSNCESDEACGESGKIHRVQNKIVRDASSSSGSDGEEMSLQDQRRKREDVTGSETVGSTRQQISQHLRKMNIDGDSDGGSQKHIRRQVYKCLRRMKVDGDSGSDASSDSDISSLSYDRRTGFIDGVSLVKAASHMRKNSPKVNRVVRGETSVNRDSGHLTSHMVPPQMPSTDHHSRAGKHKADVRKRSLKTDPAYISQVKEKLARLTSKANVLAHMNAALKDGRTLQTTRCNNPTSPGRSNHSSPGRSKTTSPRRSNQSSPGWSNQSSPGRSNHSSPGRSNHSSPGRSNHSSPGRSNHSSPGRSNHSSPGRSNHSSPGRSNHSSPGQSNHSSPGRSNHSSPGRSNPSKARKVFHDLKSQQKPAHAVKYYPGVTQLNERGDSKVITRELIQNQTQMKSSPKCFDSMPDCMTVIKTEDGVGRGTELRKTRKSLASHGVDTGIQNLVVKRRLKDRQTKPPVETALIDNLSDERQHNCQIATDDRVALHGKPSSCKNLFAGKREPIIVGISQLKTEVLHCKIVRVTKDESVHSDDEETEATHMFSEQSFDDDKSHRIDHGGKGSPAQKTDQQSCKDDKSHRIDHEWKRPAQNTYKDMEISPARKADQCKNIQRELEHQSSLKAVSNKWHGSLVNEHDDRARESRDAEVNIPVSRWKHCRNHSSAVPDESNAAEVLFHKNRTNLNQRQPKADYTFETSVGTVAGRTTSTADVGNRNLEGIPPDSKARKKYNVKQTGNARVDDSSHSGKLLKDQRSAAKKGTKRQVKEDTFVTFSNKKQRSSLLRPLTKEEDKTEITCMKDDSDTRAYTFITETKSRPREKKVSSVYASAENQCTTRVDTAPRIRHKHAHKIGVRTAEVCPMDSPPSATKSLSPGVGSTSKSWVASPDETFVVESTSRSSWQTTGWIDHDRLETSAAPRVTRSRQKQSTRQRTVHEVFPTERSRDKTVRSQADTQTSTDHDAILSSKTMTDDVILLL